MICPNCGYNQQEGNVCGECHTLLKGGSSTSSHGIEQGWKKVKTIPAPPTSKKSSTVPPESKKEPPKKKELKIQEISDSDMEEQKTISMGTFEESSGEMLENVIAEIEPEGQEEKIKTVESSPARRPLRVKKSVARAESPISLTFKRLQEVSVTTTNSFKGKNILEYKGIVQSSSIAKLETLDSYSETVKDVGGLRNTPFQELLSKAMAIALSDLKIEAVKLNADGIVGIKVQHEYGNQNILLVHMIGTAVQLEG